MMSSETPAALLRTPLHAMHVARGAQMAAFAGYDMPIQYPSGVFKEHLQTRAAVGFFDVSHMGQFALRPKSGDVADAARALERLVPVDILGLKPGRQRYALFTNANGGVLDDLMVAHRGDHLLLVVNAACKAADETHLRTHLADDCDIERLDRALIALQGPAAEAALARIAPGVETMRFMDVQDVEICGARCVASRSGYTGEDGFEISIPNDAAEMIAAAVCEDPRVAPIGLGARDSLRLEAGLCLYGSDLDAATTPIEAALAWAIQPVRRRSGARAGGFPGDSIILDQLETGPSRFRVGLLAEGRAPVRAGAALFETELSPEPIGLVTSGGFGPSLNRPVAMGYVPAAHAKPGDRVHAEVRGQRLPLAVTALPFISSKFKRG
ncbi:MAG: glycine cleavage system aminomethyltransferase GcvT [Hyphomicrobium sp.]